MLLVILYIFVIFQNINSLIQYVIYYGFRYTFGNTTVSFYNIIKVLNIVDISYFKRFFFLLFYANFKISVRDNLCFNIVFVIENSLLLFLKIV